MKTQQIASRRARAWRIAVVGALSVAAPALALDREDLIFHATFEKGLNADFAKGAPTAKAEGKPRLVPGDAEADKGLAGRNGGKAARFDAKGDLLRFAVADNVHLPQGAVSLWVRELDTKPGQRIWNPYFQIVAGKRTFNLLRLWQPIDWAGGLWEGGQKFAVVGGDVVEVPGEEKVRTGDANVWHHLLLTWRKNCMVMYVNGKPANRADQLDVSFPETPADFTLGRPAKPTVNADGFHTGEQLLKEAPEKAKEMRIGQEPYGAYLLDDVAIFNRFLGPDEVAALYAMPLDQALAAGRSGGPELTIWNFFTSRKVKVDADFGLREPDGAVAEAMVLTAEGAPTAVRKALRPTPGGFDYAMLDVGALPLGKYQAIARLTHGGQTLAETPAKPFDIPQPEVWMNNDCGKEDVVLPGFEPLKADGPVVTLWGRSYDFTGSIMPRQVTNQGRPMLTQPINWFVRVNGQDLPLIVDAMKLAGSSDTRAMYEGKGTLGPLAVTAKVLVEYDGFMKFDLTFAPTAAPVKIERLWMDVPMAPAVAKNMYFPTRRVGFWDKTWKSPLVNQRHIITLGTPDIALQWLTESDEHYFPRGNPEALATLEADNAQVFRTTVVGADKDIRGPMSLTFALQAGPVKPRPEGWRGWTCSHDTGGRRYLDPTIHQSVNFGYFQPMWCRSPGDPIPANGYDDPSLKDEFDATSIHFQGFRDFREKDVNKWLPEWIKYKQEWARVPVVLNTGVDKPGWNEILVDTNSSWADWYVYHIHQLFSRTKFRGLYFDDWTHGPSMNEAAGSGYVDEDGIRRPTWAIYSQREIHRRVYAIVKKYRPDDGRIIIHTSAYIMLPVLGFADMALEGETLGWVDLCPPDGNYFDTFRRDLFQMLVPNHYSGAVPIYYEYPAGSNNKSMKCLLPDSQRQLWALLLTHDIHAYAKVKSDELLYFYLDNGFPLTDSGVTFHAYWEDQPAARVIRAAQTLPDAKEEVDRASVCWASAYSKPNGEALVIVVRDAPNNWTNVMDVEVKLDRQKLGLPEGDLVSLELESLGRKEKGAVEGDLLKVPVGRDDFSAVIVKAKK